MPLVVLRRVLLRPVQGKIKTVAGESTQREIFYLIKDGETWLIDDIIVTDEEIDLEKMRL